MRYLLIILILLIPSVSYGAIASSAVWEVRSTGNDINGGGFNSQALGGTDYSQQNTAQNTYTTLNSNASTTLRCDVPDSFPTNATGNMINIRSGTNFLTGIYQINTCISRFAVVVDRVSGTSATSGVGALGGAFKSLALCGTYATSGVVAGNYIWVKNGNYVCQTTTSSVLSTRVAAANGLPITIEGYNVNRNDVPLGNNRPNLRGDRFLNGVKNTTNCLLGNSPGWVFKNLILSNSSSSCFSGNGVGCIFINIKSTNNATGNNFAGGGNTVTFIGCEFSFSPAVGLNLSTTTDGSGIFYCYAHDNVTNGFSLSGSGTKVVGSISSANQSAGFLLGANVSLFNCIAFNNKGATGSGFRWGSVGSTSSLVYNCVSVNNSRYGLERASLTVVPVLENYNTYYGNTIKNLLGVNSGNNSFSIYPSFENPIASDFTVKTNSIAIDRGYPDTNWTRTMGLPIRDLGINMGIDQKDHVSTGYVCSQ